LAAFFRELLIQVQVIQSKKSVKALTGKVTLVAVDADEPAGKSVEGLDKNEENQPENFSMGV